MLSFLQDNILSFCEKEKRGGERNIVILTRKITSLFSKHLSHYCHLKQAKRVAGLFSSFVFKAYSKFYFIKVMKTNRKFVVQKVRSGLWFSKYTAERMQVFWSKSRSSNLHWENIKEHSKCNTFVKIAKYPEKSAEETAHGCKLFLLANKPKPGIESSIFTTNLFIQQDSQSKEIWSSHSHRRI